MDGQQADWACRIVCTGVFPPAPDTGAWVANIDPHHTQPEHAELSHNLIPVPGLQIAKKAAQAWAVGQLLYEQGINADDIGIIVAAADVMRAQLARDAVDPTLPPLDAGPFDNTYASKLFVLQNMLTVSSNWIKCALLSWIGWI